MQVCATGRGYYGNKYLKEGDVFTLADEKDFSKTWMKRLPEPAAEVRSVAKPKSDEKAKKPDDPKADDDLKKDEKGK